LIPSPACAEVATDSVELVHCVQIPVTSIQRTDNGQRETLAVVAGDPHAKVENC
jgi:hypothetical protein